MDEYNRVLNKLKLTLMKEFDQAKFYLQEKNAKLTMFAKTQDRLAQIKLRKLNKPEEELKLEEIVNQDSKEDEDEEFDDTLENLMTLDGSNQGDKSMATEGVDGQGKEKKDEEGGKAA